MTESDAPTPVGASGSDGSRLRPDVTSSRPSAPPAYAPAAFDGRVRHHFERGRERPRGVVWFGLQSFWGHLRHFVASAIATEDVDSRDWMTADLPDELVRRVARRLGSRTRASTVTESLGRDIWIDYVADTGDDVSVSRAVATLIFAQYELPDPSNPGTRLRAPRGDLLLFGGDTAYPVATAEEIRGRIVEPFNSVLDGRVDNGSRVVLGIPGNHDWYDGLDGFGRLFRRHLDDNPYGTLRPSADTRHPTVLARTAAWTREFVRGGKVKKPRTLELIGYGAVQGASYFALPLAPGVCMLAVDRQLKEIDVRQQRFFESFLNQRLSVTPWLVLPDPVHAFGEPSETGVGMVDALGLTLSARAHFVLSGDIHHYRREQDGKTLHVTAGGGGAFLHPAAIRPRGKLKAQVEFPSVAQSRRLLRRVPAKVALGRSGFLPHLAFLALFAPTLWFERTSFEQIETVLVPATIVTLTLTLLYALIGGVRRGHRVTIAFAFVAALLTAALPAIAMAAMEWMWHSVDIQLPPRLVQLLLWGTAAFIGAYIFGSYLALLTRLGFENTQAFTALDHPGFKHFVRLRVRADGSRVDAWCLGLVDPLSDEKPVLVDSFTWFPRL
ncbi:MAG: hypothetical protein RJA70_3734 [Pseudomonadota bacterium]